MAKVSGLAPGAAYVFRVRALNLSGWSPWSAPSDITSTSTGSHDMSAVYRHFGAVEAAFRAFDRDRDGLVSKKEFMLGMSKYRSSVEQRARLFDMASQGGAALTYSDFASLFCRPTPTSKPENEASRSPLREVRRPMVRNASPKGSKGARMSPRLKERALQPSAETLGCGNHSGSCHSSRTSSPALYKRDPESGSDAEIELKDSGCDSARRHRDVRRTCEKLSLCCTMRLDARVKLSH